MTASKSRLSRLSVILRLDGVAHFALSLLFAGVAASCGGQRADTAPRSPGPSVSQRARGALLATGHGETVPEAQEKALSALSQSVLSQISSQFISTARQVNDRASQTVEDTLSVSSRVLFKGVVYSPPRQSDNGSIVVDAVLSREALADTVDYLRREVTQRIDILDVPRLREVLAHAGFLAALLTTPAAASLPNREQLLETASEVREEVNQRLNQGLVIFEGDLEGATITMDSVMLPRGAEHFLPPGRHGFIAEMAEHHTLRGQFHVSPGQRKIIRLQFIRRRNKPTSLHVVYPADFGFLRDEFEAAFSQFGVSANGGRLAGNALRLRVKDEVVGVGEHRKHRMVVFIEAYRGEEVVTKIRAAQEYYSTSETEDYLRKKKSTELARRLVPTLIKKMDADGLFSDRAFDYERFFRSQSGE